MSGTNAWIATLNDINLVLHIASNLYMLNLHWHACCVVLWGCITGEAFVFIHPKITWTPPQCAMPVFELLFPPATMKASKLLFFSLLSGIHWRSSTFIQNKHLHSFTRCHVRWVTRHIVSSIPQNFLKRLPEEKEGRSWGWKQVLTSSHCTQKNNQPLSTWKCTRPML